LNDKECTACKHECPEYGASCDGSTLLTCVFDENGCRKLLSEKCDLGCGDSACNTCSQFPRAQKGTILDQQYSYITSLVMKGNFAVGAWSKPATYGNGQPYEPAKNTLLTVDYSSPGSPSVANVMVFPDGYSLYQLNKVGQDYFAALTPKGIDIYDISSPAKPSLVSSFPQDLTSPLPARDLSVDGSLACALVQAASYDQKAVVHFIDLGDPTHPKELAAVETMAGASRVVCANNRMVVAGESVMIWDILDPKKPTLLLEDAKRKVRYGALAFNGDLLFLSENHTTNGLDTDLNIYRVQPGTGLGLVKQLRNFPTVHQYLFQGNSLFYIGTDTLGAIDISNAATPRWLKHAVMEGAGQTLGALDSSTTVVGGNGLHVVDWSRLPDLHFEWLDEKVYMTDMETMGSLTLVGLGGDGFAIQDVRDPLAPVELSRVKTPKGMTDIEVVGQHAFVAHSGGFSIYDIACPWRPRLLSDVKSPRGYDGQPEHIRALTIAESYAILGSLPGICFLYDISNPAAPVLVPDAFTSVNAKGGTGMLEYFVRHGDWLLVGGGYGVQLIDIHDPKAPVLLSNLYSGQSTSAAIAGSIAFVATQTCGVDIYDVADPSSPTTIGKLFSCYLAVKITNLFIKGTFLYVATGSRLYVYDISVPASPVLMTDYWTSARPINGFFSGRYFSSYNDDNNYASYYDYTPRHQFQTIEICDP
jgi:hypothetical protein